MPIRVELNALPLVRIRYVGDYTNDELDDFLDELDRLLRRPGRKLALIDLLDSNVSPPMQRRRQADWIARNERVLRRDFAACAIVLDNPLLRGAVTAIFWISPLPLPTHIAASRQEAQGFLRPYFERLHALQLG